MSIDELNIFSPFRHRSFEVIAEGVGSGRDLLEDTSDDRLLPLFAEDVLVELHQTRFPAIVYDYYSLYHSDSLSRSNKL